MLYVDPPWDPEVWSRETGMDRHPANHYPVMSVDQIKAIKVPAAKDCALFMWATVQMLRKAIEVMEAWGFTYVSSAAWDKEQRAKVERQRRGRRLDTGKNDR